MTPDVSHPQVDKIKEDILCLKIGIVQIVAFLLSDEQIATDVNASRPSTTVNTASEDNSSIPGLIRVQIPQGCGVEKEIMAKIPK